MQPRAAADAAGRPAPPKRRAPADCQAAGAAPAGRRAARPNAHLLPGAPAGRLRAWVPPVTQKLGPRLVVIADPRERFELDAAGELRGRDLNGQAVFLTIDLRSGFGRQICGSALVLCAEPGADLSVARYDALEGVVQGRVMEAYEDGEPPSEADWADLARELEESLQGQ